MADEQPPFLQGLDRLHQELNSLQTPLRRMIVKVIPEKRTDGYEMSAEVAETPQAIANGLMFRKELEQDSGMLFLFPDARPRSFWMKNTPIPLDMIFIGPDNDVVGVVRDAQPHSEALVGFADPVKAVLEVNAGWTWSRKVDKGAFVLWPEDQLKTAAEFAPGIPEKGRFVDIPRITEPRQLPYTIHAHSAARAGKHLDLRIGDTATGALHSWALKKLPEPGKSTYAPQQFTHDISYGSFEGTIPAGTYGAGTVEIARRGEAEVLKANDNEVRFNLYGTRVPEQFVMKRQTGRMWTIHNVTPSRAVKKWQELIPADKPSMKGLPIGTISPAVKDQVWQPKIDGAHAIGVLEAGKPMRVFSYREAKTPTGLIEHTFRLPKFWENVVPEGMRPTVIRGELWGEKDGKPIHVSQLGGILNASVPESRQRQEQQGIKLHFTAEDIERHEGKKVGIQPFERTDQILKDLAAQVSGIEVMPSAVTPAQKEKLRQQIQSGAHKLTREGIVVRSRRTADVWKAKEYDPHDVFIREVYPGTKPGEAGGFRYSWTEHGPVIGNTGGGFSRAQRVDMLANPENWIGRVAKVRAQEKLRSGALRVPVFESFHETRGPQPYHEIATSE